MATDLESKHVSSLSDDELREVIKQRKQKRLEARAKRNEELTDVIHGSADVQRFLRMLVPEHSRSTCSDNARNNVGRCTRCDVLDLIAGNDLEAERTIVFYFSRDIPEDGP